MRFNIIYLGILAIAVESSAFCNTVSFTLNNRAPLRPTFNQPRSELRRIPRPGYSTQFRWDLQDVEASQRNLWNNPTLTPMANRTPETLGQIYPNNVSVAVPPIESSIVEGPVGSIPVAPPFVPVAVSEEASGSSSPATATSGER